MKRRLIVLMAKLCLAYSAFGVAASQEWVKSKLAEAQVRISMATVTTNVVAGVTNIVFTSPFRSAEYPQYTTITLVATPAVLSWGDADCDRSRPYVSCTLTDVRMSDGVSVYSFGGGWELARNIELPDPAPTGVHECDVGTDCYCSMARNTRQSVLASIPDEYKDLTPREAAATWPSPLSMIDKESWGSQDGQKKITVGNTVRYFITDSPADPSQARTVNVEALGDSDAWAECVAQMAEQWNSYLRILRDLYVDERICTAANPQHDWQTMTCGSRSWRRCRRNHAHTDGSHQYPGTSYTAAVHSCVCGEGAPEPHGELVPSGVKTPTYSGSVKTGWTLHLVCPSGCGYTKTQTHRCHHTDCGPCDAGDDCEEACHCQGEHVLNGAKDGKCERCKCPTCKDCSYFREDAQYHTGWTPCSEDFEDDNDDGTARGAHCTCQCGWFSHNSALYGENPSEHDYRSIVGEDPYMPIDDSKNESLRATMHYRKIKRCKRCGQRKSAIESHVFPESPTRYSYVSDSVCARIYKCTSRGCGYERKDEDDGGAPYPHVLPATPDLYENFSPAVCRYKYKCANCQSYVNDDTHGHVRNTGDECKCANGCGYQFDHAWITSACGEEVCSYCEKSRYSQHVPTGWTDNGDGTHTCACEKETEAHGELVPSETKTPTYDASGKETGWTQELSCPKDCGYTTTKTHVHHFTDCGVCDAGDDCAVACTGCSGNHVFGNATATECAKCECAMCSDCKAHPPYTDVAKHVGWHPCGEADEAGNDNADGSARGGHCACQCLAWGHNAALEGENPSEHDYQLPSGYDRYEQITDASATDYAKDYHYELLGKCSRNGCGRWKKRREAHSWPESPTRYEKVSDSTCRRYYVCQASGCGYERHDDEGGHSLSGAVVYEAITVNGSPKCRQKRLCDNCQSYVNDDTHDHVRNASDECKCANGCGYQFDHAWTEDACGNSVCSHCGTYQYSQESHSGYKSGGTYSAAGHQCMCGRKPDVPHVFGQPVEVSRAGWEVTYRRTCESCAYYYDDVVNVNPCKNGHVGLQDACGCACGYYSPTGQVAAVKSLHHWSEGGANGNPECICDCGNMHQFKDEDSYAKNLFPSTSNVVQCLGICWACRERDSSDRVVSDESHQAMSESEARGAARCGCKCGKVRSSSIEKFHYRNSTGIGGLPKCRCYGNDARADGAVAGEYHFLDASDCPKVCAISVGGELHRSAATDKAWEPAFVPAEVKDHKKKETGNTCGCACGKYHTGNWSQWHGLADFHVLYSGCKCGCPSNKHFPIPKEGCTRLCDGNCTGLFEDKIWGQTAGALSNPEYHDPSDSDCRCRCNYFYGASAPDKFHSVSNSTTPCFCVGMHRHKFPTPRSDCTTICASCGNGYTYAVAPSDKYEIGQHQWDGNQCKCKCPAKAIRPEGHRFDPDACVCFCGEQTRGHDFVQYAKTQSGSHVCSSCGNTITEYQVTYKCRRTKCDAESSGSTEEGHAAGCGLDPGSQPPPQENYCDVHGLYYDVECPKCANAGSGGTGTGGGTGGPGGFPDI